MNREILAAIDTLTEIMVRENTALGSMDLRAAALFSEDKRRAIAVLAGLPRRPDPGPLLQEAVARLEQATNANRNLLERGLAAQGRVIGLIARAAQTARRDKGGDGTRYTAYGGRARPVASAMAISARI